MLSDNIRKYRKANQMSQDELAEKLEVTRQSISLWETGQTQPSLDNIVALAKLFDVSTDALLTDNETVSAEAEAAIARPVKSTKKKPIIIIAVCLAVVLAASLSLFLWKNKDSVDGDSQVPETPTTSETVDASQEVSRTDKISNLDETDTIKNETEGPAPEKSEEAVETPASSKEIDLYGYLKDFVVQNGTLNGDYCYYSKSADNYGGYADEDFTLYYWGDTDTVEFSLHSTLDDTFSISFYLLIPKSHTASYEYISSYYYRDNGEPLYEAKGTIDAEKFTKSYPLTCSKYIGSADAQNDFMEMSRQGICDLIDCLKNFITAENLEYSFRDFGFAKF